MFSSLEMIRVSGLCHEVMFRSQDYSDSRSKFKSSLGQDSFMIGLILYADWKQVIMKQLIVQACIICHICVTPYTIPSPGLVVKGICHGSRESKFTSSRSPFCCNWLVSCQLSQENVAVIILDWCSIFGSKYSIKQGRQYDKELNFYCFGGEVERVIPTTGMINDNL